MHLEVSKLNFILKAELELIQGQKNFNQAIFDAENLDIDMLYDAIDNSNNAQKIAFDNKDTELEARCEAFVGKILYMGLKKLQKAKRHLSNAVRLENTLRPRKCSGDEWFKSCKIYLDNITR